MKGHTISLTGTPPEIASQVAQSVVLPFIQPIAQALPAEALAQFYGGLMCSVIAFAAADFDMATALEIAQHVIDTLNANPPQVPGTH